MNWLADVGNMLLGAEQAPENAKANADTSSGIAVYANGASSSGGNQEEVEAMADAELAKLANLNLGDSENRDGYLEEKMAEIMEYTELLDQANAAEDPFERLALVAAFLVSPFGAAERTWKPFNPLLGETFELHNLGNNVHFLAEQLQEHPPVSAAHAENGNFNYDIVSAPATKFQGNSLEVYPKGRTRISLKRTGELFSHVPPQAKVHNLVIGKAWIDSFGQFLVTNNATGDRVELDFKACGWFGSGQYEFDGFVLDAEGNAKGIMSGKWNSYVELAPCHPDGTPVADTEKRRLWTCKDKPEDDAYGCTHFAWDLTNCRYLTKPPMASDSRRRADRHALQERQMAAAAVEKGMLDEQQRQEAKVREEQGEQWQPRWFDPAPDMQVLPGEEPADMVPLWRYNGKYSTEKRDDMPTSVSGWQDEVIGKGFCPWQYHDAPVQAEQQQ
eukprot:GHRR01011869.1.p1 GENE.GHRR01011869.1~~GHRR01011869.1.p1  ORF type:complete len:445 (+),score=178.41 GHRR01011869.1:119-1453(+)